MKNEPTCRGHSWLWLVVLVAFGTSTVAPRGAVAAPVSTKTRLAKQLFGSAESHFARKDFERAMRLYYRSYRLVPLPGFLFNIGVCHQRLGEHQQALQWLRRFLATSPSPPRRERAEKLIALSQKALSPVAPASQATPTGPTTAQGAAGSKPPALAAANRSQGRADRGKANADRSQREVSVPQHSRRKVSPAWFWSSAAVSGSLLVAGTITGVLALRRHAAYSDPTTAADRLPGLKRSGETLAKAASITVLAGGVAAAATTVLYFFTDFRRERTSLTVAPVVGGGILVVGGSY